MICPRCKEAYVYIERTRCDELTLDEKGDRIFAKYPLITTERYICGNCGDLADYGYKNMHELSANVDLEIEANIPRKEREEGK